MLRAWEEELLSSGEKLTRAPMARGRNRIWEQRCTAPDTAMVTPRPQEEAASILREVPLPGGVWYPKSGQGEMGSP